jgi:hypothetical protein
VLPLGKTQARAVAIQPGFVSGLPVEQATRTRCHLSASDWECHMRVLALVLVAASLAFATVAPSFAHGDKPHPKCKKGYTLNDEHKCVKKKDG